jgi:hypothetical protein
MKIDSRISTKLGSLDQAPEPFLRALSDELPAEKPIRSLIHAPAISTAEIRSPTTVLAVTEDNWLVASENEDGSISVDKCSLADTLFLELMSTLLWGRLKIDYASVGSSYAATVQFHTLGEELYREAIRCMLDGINRVTVPAAEESRDAAALVQTWPPHFRNEVQRYRSGGQRLLAAVQWPAIIAGFRRELAPAGALLVTECDLVLMTEDKAPSSMQAAAQKFGGTTTYFPLRRMVDYHVGHQERFSILALEVHARHGGEKLEIIFPSGHEKSVRKAMEQAGVEHR